MWGYNGGRSKWYHSKRKSVKMLQRERSLKGGCLAISSAWGIESVIHTLVKVTSDFSAVNFSQDFCGNTGWVTKALMAFAFRSCSAWHE